MLKELVQALVKQADLRTEFRRDPARILQRFEVTAAEQKVLLEQDEAGLVAALGAELLKEYRAVDRRLQVGYPGTPKLHVTEVKVNTGTNGSLDIGVTWQHEGTPQFGLPAWVRVDILNEAKQELHSNCVVPAKLNFVDCTAAVTAPVNLGKGHYHVVLCVTHPEVQDSDPFAFSVNA